MTKPLTLLNQRLQLLRKTNQRIVNHYARQDAKKILIAIEKIEKNTKKYLEELKKEEPYYDITEKK